MIIRIFDEERANICDSLLSKLIQDERQYDNSIDEKFIVKDYFKNVIKNKDNILLCYEEGTVIKGYIYLKSITIDDKQGYLIDGLYVDEMYRNNGIASKLMESAFNMIKDYNVNFIDVNVLVKNEGASYLYKKYGFNEFKINYRKYL